MRAVPRPRCAAGGRAARPAGSAWTAALPSCRRLAPAEAMTLASINAPRHVRLAWLRSPAPVHHRDAPRRSPGTRRRVAGCRWRRPGLGTQPCRAVRHARFHRHRRGAPALRRGVHPEPTVRRGRRGHRQARRQDRQVPRRRPDGGVRHGRRRRGRLPPGAGRGPGHRAHRPRRPQCRDIAGEIGRPLRIGMGLGVLGSCAWATSAMSTRPHRR